MIRLKPSRSIKRHVSKQPLFLSKSQVSVLMLNLLFLFYSLLEKSRHSRSLNLFLVVIFHPLWSFCIIFHNLRSSLLDLFFPGISLSVKKFSFVVTSFLFHLPHVLEILFLQFLGVSVLKIMHLINYSDLPFS